LLIVIANPLLIKSQKIKLLVAQISIKFVSTFDSKIQHTINGGPLATLNSRIAISNLARLYMCPKFVYMFFLTT